jgi:hypothetical protein
LTSEEGKIIPAAEVLVHPEYNPDVLINDVALIRLAEPVDVEPVHLLSPEEEEAVVAGATGTILGWGMKDPWYPILPDVLQQAEVPVYSAEECLDEIGILYSPEHQICAGIKSTSFVEIDGVDSCYGDSGGPLLVEDAGVWKQAGIVSWGFDCAAELGHGVYHRVAKTHPWILSKIDTGSKIRSILSNFAGLLEIALKTGGKQLYDSPTGISSPKEAREELRAGLAALREAVVQGDVGVTADYPLLSQQSVKKLSKLTKRALKLPKKQRRLKKRLLKKVARLIEEIGGV